MLRIFAALTAVVVFALPVSAEEKRVALVVGNGSYASVSKLLNPPRDAGAIATLLRNAGFDAVVLQTELTVTGMRRALRDFSALAQEADVAVVFYAGHGIEVNGTNYLIPIDAVLERDSDVEDETVALDRIIQLLERVKRLRLIILDACRDNPFTRSMRRTMASRSIGRGLGKVDVASFDTLVAFAAKHGSTAADGDGVNSPYTSALLKHLATPGLDLRLALGRVRDEVLSSTANRQEPFVYGSLGGSEVALVAASASPTIAGQMVPQPSEAAEAWDRTKDTASTNLLEAFIARYRGTFYADLARARLEELKKAPTTMVASPSTERPSIAAATTPQEPHAKSEPKGTERQIQIQPIALRHFWSADSNCNSRSPPTVWITRPPNSGKIEVRIEMRKAQRAIFGSSKCVGTNLRSRVLYYMPTPSPMTEDEVSFRATFREGSKNYTCKINLVQRSANCTMR